MKSNNIAERAAEMYTEGKAIETIASELGVAYRTARKAINSKGVQLRDPSARLVGRTRPDRQRTVENA